VGLTAVASAGGTWLKREHHTNISNTRGEGGGPSFEYYAAYWIFSLNDSFDFPAERRQIKTVGTRVAIKPALCYHIQYSTDGSDLCIIKKLC